MGNILEGLEDLQVDEEIWMQSAPPKEQLLRHELKPSNELETHQSDRTIDVIGHEGRRRGDQRRIERDIGSEADVSVETECWSSYY